jgi:hypothetical protein
MLKGNLPLPTKHIPSPNPPESPRNMPRQQVIAEKKYRQGRFGETDRVSRPLGETCGFGREVKRANFEELQFPDIHLTVLWQEDAFWRPVPGVANQFTATSQ